MFEKISKKIGFTEIEIKVILFLIISLIAGIIIKSLKDGSLQDRRVFDYSKEDSLFNKLTADAKAKRNNSYSNGDSSSQTIKNEVLGLNKNQYKKKEVKQPPKEKSIEINSAGISELISLPGIGEKTAQLIIELRESRGYFKELDELKDVKGIGEVKFNKIKKFLYIK